MNCFLALGNTPQSERSTKQKELISILNSLLPDHANTFHDCRAEKLQQMYPEDVRDYLCVVQACVCSHQPLMLAASSTLSDGVIQLNKPKKVIRVKETGSVCAVCCWFGSLPLINLPFPMRLLVINTSRRLSLSRSNINRQRWECRRSHAWVNHSYLFINITNTCYRKEEIL